MIASQVKAWLLRYGELNTEIENAIERIEMLRSRLEAPRTSVVDGMPHSGGVESDRSGGAIANVVKLEDEAREKIRKARRVYDEIEAAISQIHIVRWPDLRAVLRMRYLDLASWQEASMMLWGRKENFADNEESYLRRTMRIHSEALNALADILDETEGTGKGRNL